MTDRADRLWFIDGRSGEIATYVDLLAVLNQNPGKVRPLCQPRTTRDALQEIAAAVAFGTGLTLLDSDFGEHELTALGYGDAPVNGTVGAPWKGEAVTLQTLQGLAAGRSPAHLGLFTSGSTGLPQLVVQPVANLARAVKVSDRHAQDVWGFAYNPTHVAGIQVYLQALANGCPVVDIFGLGRGEVLAAIARYGITHLSATPSFYRLMLPADQALPGVRSVTLGGESADAALLDRLRPLFPSARVHNVYASTEAGTLLTTTGDTFSIADGLERLVVIREGKIQVHRSLLGEFSAGVRAVVACSQPGAGPQFLRCKIEAGTTEGGRRTAEDGGEAVKQTDGLTTLPSHGMAADAADWYDTGDVVEIVSDQPLRFRIVARERDCVNVGGSKVNPREVEAVLEEHPGVRKARVSGRANSVMGHILCAEIECDGIPPTEPAMRVFAAARLQPFKVPRLIRFVDNIALTRTGKVSRQ